MLYLLANVLERLVGSIFWVEVMSQKPELIVQIMAKAWKLG
jgi:hypothetical protein